MKRSIPRRKNPWKTIGPRTVYKGQWTTIRSDSVLRPNGKPGSYDVLLRPHGSQVIAFNDRGEVCVVGQFRYPTKRWSWELPGGLHDNPKETKLQAAQREFREETGLIMKTWTHLGDFPLLCGTTPACVQVFVAEGVRRRVKDKALEDGITEMRWVPLEELFRMIRPRVMDNCPVLAGLFVYCLRRGFTLHEK